MMDDGWWWWTNIPWFSEIHCVAVTHCNLNAEFPDGASSMLSGFTLGKLRTSIPTSPSHQRTGFQSLEPSIHIINILKLVGGLGHVLFFHILGISSSQLTKSIIFQSRSRLKPPTSKSFQIHWNFVLPQGQISVVPNRLHQKPPLGRFAERLANEDWRSTGRD